MSDTSPYGVTQNADAAHVTANQLVGTRVGLTTAEGIVGSAAMFSTAPYVPPHKVITGCHGKQGMCRAYPISGTDFCIFHTKEPGEPSTAP